MTNAIILGATVMAFIYLIYTILECATEEHNER